MSGYHLPHYFWDLLDWFVANHFLQALFAKLYYGQRLFLCSWAIVTGEHFITKWWHSVKYPGAWTNASTTSWQWVSWVHLAQQPPTDVSPKFVNGAIVAHVLTFVNTLDALLTKIPLKPQEYISGQAEQWLGHFAWPGWFLLLLPCWAPSTKYSWSEAGHECMRVRSPQCVPRCCSRLALWPECIHSHSCFLLSPSVKWKSQF